MNVTSFISNPLASKPSVCFGGDPDSPHKKLQEMLNSPQGAEYVRRPAERFGADPDRVRKKLLEMLKEGTYGPSATGRTSGVRSGQASEKQRLVNELTVHLIDKLNVEYLAEGLPDEAKRVILYDRLANPGTSQEFLTVLSNWLKNNSPNLTDQSVAELLHGVFTDRPEQASPQAVLKAMEKATGGFSHKDVLQEKIWDAANISAQKILKLMHPMPKADPPDAVYQWESLATGIRLYSLLDNYSYENNAEFRVVTETPLELAQRSKFNFKDRNKPFDITEFDYPLDKGMMTAMATDSSDSPLRWLRYTKENRNHTVELAVVQDNRVHYYQLQAQAPRRGRSDDYFAEEALKRINRFFAKAHLKKQQPGL